MAPPGRTLTVSGGAGVATTEGGAAMLADGTGCTAARGCIFGLTMRTIMKTSIAIAIAARSHANIPVDAFGTGAALCALIGAVGGVVHAAPPPPVNDGALGFG